MTASQRRGVAYYDRDAATFAARYDSVTFDAVHQGIAPFIPSVPATILDVGAGSGRDARALAARGYVVTAIEPSAALRAHAEHGDARIRWVDDRLPALADTVAAGARYDFILCSAVLMLLDEGELPPAFRTLASLLERGAHLAVSVRNPVDDEPRDIFHAHKPSTILEAAAAAKLAVVDERPVSDALGRNPHHWRSFVFKSLREDQPPGSGSLAPRKSS